MKTLYGQTENAQERTAMVKEKLGAFSDKLLELNPRAFDDIEKACLAEDGDRFAEAMMPILEPLIHLKIENLVEFERITRIDFNKKFIPLNDVLSYGRDGNTIHLHVPPSESIGLKEKMYLLKSGLIDLAAMVKDDPTIVEITGTSWIVAKAPKLLESLGFTDRGLVSDEKRREYFGGETRPVAEAYISRQDLLDRYLSKNN